MSRLLAGLQFTKLEALGNDFVVLDFRDGRADPPTDQVQALADRHTGIGFDQLLILRPATAPDSDCAVSIYNADGSVARQCGNGMRALGLWLHQQAPDRRRFQLDTAAGSIDVKLAADQHIEVSMGRPDFAPSAVGLRDEDSLAAITAAVPGHVATATVQIGNPHLVILLDAPATAAMVDQLGRALSRDARFPDGINVSFAHLAASDRVRLSVHERGVGPTRACGSAACATAAWLLDQALVQSPVRVEQPGGTLVIDWPGRDHSILMSGPARRVFDGTLQ